MIYSKAMHLHLSSREECVFFFCICSAVAAATLICFYEVVIAFLKCSKSISDKKKWRTAWEDRVKSSTEEEFVEEKFVFDWNEEEKKEERLWIKKFGGGCEMGN